MAFFNVSTQPSTSISSYSIMLNDSVDCNSFLSENSLREKQICLIKEAEKNCRQIQSSTTGEFPIFLTKVLNSVYF